MLIMNIEEFREYCLSFTGADERLPFYKSKSEYNRNILVFSVSGKWFAFVNIDKFDFCDLKSDPEKSKKLLAEYDGITPGYHMNKKHWISVYFRMDVPDKTVKDLVKASYELVVKGLPKKDRKKIGI